ncbi:hypothetical protein QQY66_31355 [Streptomyces sp. DG2A-72]|uniref:hypothetical protein n=1 Tax=Streptomyces sp. DG2A-72 TaxID=3051386 RepID=UPI00265C07D1|nr:hypothetical protein [Streptomyces sp. DG2A-72]MDO0935972.1 hypothetical protein [Streptomyces sp. DG2A-72]
MPSEHQEDLFEHQLGNALRDTGDTFDTDRSALAAAGQARGHRLRLRRRAAVVGSAAAIALVGLGGALAVPWSDGGGQQSVGSGRTTTAPASSATPEPNAITAEEVLKMFKSLLPEGEFSQEVASSTDSYPSYTSLVYDDGQGPAAMGLSLNRVEPGSAEARDLTTCPDKALTPYDSCTTTRLVGGSTLMLFQGYEYPDRREETKLWRAELVTSHGQHIGLSEWNAPAQKGEPVSRPEPPLSTAELKAFVTASQWRPVIAVIPQELKGTPPDGPDITTTLTTLIGLLPKDVEVVTRGTDYTYLVIDDGKGKSYVQVDVQPGMKDVEDELFGSDAETLDDGTKVVTRESSGDKGVSGTVMWTADTLRTDGLRVVVSAFNAADQHSAPSRETPALTLKELREIALSPKWVQPMGR